MVVDAIEKKYIQELIGHCSYFRLDVPDAGEMFYQRILLEDIYAPLRLSESKGAEELLKWGAAIADLADARHKKEAMLPMEELELAKIEGLFSACDTFEESTSPFSDLITFMDAQIGKLNRNKNEEWETFIWQLDEQIQKIKSVIEQTPQEEYIELIERIVRRPEQKDRDRRDYSDYDEKPYLNWEQISYMREQMRLFDDKPVGPILKDYPSRKVIFSNPGCGKTTLVKRIALAYAAQDKENLEIYSLPGELFPMLLYCRSLEKEEILAEDTFADVAFKMARKQYDSISATDKSAFEEMLNKHALEGTLLLLIDGYDELFDKEVQEMFAKRLHDYLQDNKNVHLVLTSRIASFVNDANAENTSISYIEGIEGIRKNLILSLNQEEIDAFVRRWHNVLFPFDPERMCHAENIIAQLRQPAFKHLEKMTSVPLHLSHILMVARASHKIPSSKVQVYDDYLRIALNWQASGKLETDDMKIQLAYIAYYMTKHGMKYMPRKYLRQLLRKCYEDLDGEFKVVLNEENIDDFITELEERASVLKKIRRISGEDFYQFSHLSLQEYLAAYAIVHRCSEDLYTPLEIVMQHFKESAWREVINQIGMLALRTERKQIVDFLLQESEESEQNYSVKNLLFEYVANGLVSKTEKRQAIYDLLFKEQITDRQINKICEFMEDERSEEFKQYVSDKFVENIETGNGNYSLALATICAYEFLREGMRPLEKAQEMVLSDDEMTILKGLSMFTIIGWCKYCKIKTVFATQDIRVTTDLSKRMKELIISYDKYLLDISTTVKDMMLAEYIPDTTFLDEEVYAKLLQELENEENKKSAKRILSVYPFDSLRLSYWRNQDVSKLQQEYLEEYEKCLADTERIEDTVFVFAICAMLGCWQINTEEFINAFIDLEGYYEKNKSKANETELSRLKILRKQISDIGNPRAAEKYTCEINAHEQTESILFYYNEQEYEGEKIESIIDYYNEEY